MSRVAILSMGASIDKWPGKGGDEYQKAYDEVWALNGMAFVQGHGRVDPKEFDRLYVMDDLINRLPYYAGQELCDSLKKYEGRIITSRVYADWPTTERFPIEDCCKEFGLPLGVAMYSSPDYMIAHALMDGFTHIDLFGVDNQDKACFEMRAATAMWIGVAMGRGVTVTAYPGSYHYLYTNTGCAMEFGLYGYAFRPRIENLVFAPDETYRSPLSDNEE